MTNDLQYPIGKFINPATYDKDDIPGWIHTLEEFPSRLRAVVQPMSEEQLNTRYREGGWTVRQVVHHLADSHLNSYVRFKLAVTEDNPTIKPYFEDRWAELKEAREAPVEVSLRLLESLHDRWTLFLKNLDIREWEKTFHHPESGKDWKLSGVLALYAWHCNHHLAHITGLCERMGWKTSYASL